MRAILIVTASILFMASCSKNEKSFEMPVIQDTIEIDIDDNRSIDYQIQFDQPFFGGPNEGTMTGIVGRIIGYADNEILQSTNGSSLFLRDLNDIEETVKEPLFWNSSGLVEIVSITTNSEGEWPSKWIVDADAEHSSYFLGLKTVGGGSSQLGWIELDVSAEDGFVSVVNMGLL